MIHLKIFCFIVICVFIFAGCNNLEDAELTERSSFIRFYESANRYISAGAIETTDGGFLVAGTIEIDGTTPAKNIWIVKTSRFGMKEWERIIPNGSVSSIKEVEGGYVVVGDSVVLTPIFSAIDDFENTSARLIILNKDGSDQLDRSFSFTSNAKHVDFHTTGLTVDDGGNFITLGTHKRPDFPEMADITALHPATLDTVWHQSFEYINRNYSNTKALYYNDGRVLWGTSITESENNFTKSYLAIPVIEERSTFINSNYFGQDKSQQAIRISDLKKNGSGYAAVGSFSETDGSGSNVFFIAVDHFGNFDPESVRYFDANTTNYIIQDPSASTTEDTGEALTRTGDGGFVLAGSSENLLRGGKDIWLLKISSSGDVVWSKTIGGKFNEHVTSIEETSDGGLVISGTSYDGANENDGLASVFLIKTDSNGELDN